MHKTLLTLAWGSLAVIGAVIFTNSRKLSLRYNAWTTDLRTRRTYINPPPTPKMRETNTRIMTWIIRLGSLWMVLLCLFLLLLTRVSN
jgi:hypothetical protein